MSSPQERTRYSDADGLELEAFALVDGAYAVITTSRVIPGLPIAEIADRVTDETESLEALHAWRDWLRADRPH